MGYVSDTPSIHYEGNFIPMTCNIHRRLPGTSFSPGAISWCGGFGSQVESSPKIMSQPLLVVVSGGGGRGSFNDVMFVKITTFGKFSYTLLYISVWRKLGRLINVCVSQICWEHCQIFIMTNARMDPERKEWRPNRIIGSSHRSFICDKRAWGTCHILLRRIDVFLIALKIRWWLYIISLYMYMLGSVGVSAFLPADIIKIWIDVSVMMCFGQTPLDKVVAFWIVFCERW